MPAEQKSGHPAEKTAPVERKGQINKPESLKDAVGNETYAGCRVSRNQVPQT